MSVINKKHIGFTQSVGKMYHTLIQKDIKIFSKNYKNDYKTQKAHICKSLKVNNSFILSFKSNSFFK